MCRLQLALALWCHLFLLILALLYPIAKEAVLNMGCPRLPTQIGWNLCTNPMAPKLPLLVWDNLESLVNFLPPFCWVIKIVFHYHCSFVLYQRIFFLFLRLRGNLASSFPPSFLDPLKVLCIPLRRIKTCHSCSLKACKPQSPWGNKKMAPFVIDSPIPKLFSGHSKGIKNKGYYT